MKRLIVSGSSGLIGSEVATYFLDAGWQVNGIDNNSRAIFFGPLGDTRRNQHRLEQHSEFRHHELDMRDRAGVLALVDAVRPHAIVHTAAQPSHDLAKERPLEGKVIAVGSGKRLEDGTLVKLDVKAGDRILFGKYAGTEIKVDGVEHIIIREDEVLGVLES